ncbi:hypothetical protein V3331_01880 [Gaopeijia maritima]|uniref:hypothetical protein n=1 Tax=Gaopeijia maritima TaxID=3119007 RepID=UPI003249D3BC
MGRKWRTTIEVAGQAVTAYEREGSAALWYSATVDGKRVGRSLKTTDRDTATRRAQVIARRLAEVELTGLDARRLTLGTVFRAYFRIKGPDLSPRWRQLAEARRAFYLEAWGEDQVVVDISQTHVDTYSKARRTGRIHSGVPGKPQKVRDGTIAGDFRWLSSVFNWARRHKEGGRRLLPENPLHDTSWPKEANPRRPVASHQRFVATMAHVDAVDDRGRLRGILALARFTGRREGAICALRASDVLRADQVRAALAGSGMDERLADHMPHGAVRWSDQSDKMGLLFISPLSEPAREELDRYLRAEPWVGDVPLFPSDEGPGAPMRTDVAARWLLKAEQAAGLPKLKGGLWHPYRRLWASERKHLPDVDIAAAGGWKGTRALQLSYQTADPATVLRVVENR